MEGILARPALLLVMPPLTVLTVGFRDSQLKRLCIVLDRGGWFQFLTNNCTHSEGGVVESANGIEYRALPHVPSFLGSVISSTITRVILMSSNCDTVPSADDTGLQLSFGAIVDIGFPMGGAVSRISNSVRTRSSYSRSEYGSPLRLMWYLPESQDGAA